MIEIFSYRPKAEIRSLGIDEIIGVILIDENYFITITFYARLCICRYTNYPKSGSVL